MKALLNAEFIQLRTTRTAMWWAGVILVLTILPPVAVLIYSPGKINMDELLHLRGLDIFLLIFSVVAVSGNYRHRVSVTEQLISPTIWQSTVCKLVVFGAVGGLVVLAQIAFVSGLIAIWPGASLKANWSDLANVGLAVLGGALSAMLGVGIARFIRVQIAAVIAAIVYFLILEPSMVGTLMWLKPALHDSLAPLLPGQAFHNLMGHGESSGIIAALVLVGWIAVLCGAAYVLDKKRD